MGDVAHSGFGVIVLAIEHAAGPGDIFPPDPDEAKAVYRRLAMATHPDANPDRQERAREAFERLSDLWDEYLGKPSRAWLTITTRKRSYAVGKLACRGTVANLYEANYEGAEGDVAPEAPVALMKMPRSVKDNDLMEAEARSLKKLEAEMDDEWLPFLPNLVESFRHRDSATGKDRRVNVFLDERLDGWYSLAEVRKANGRLDPRDFAWMFRRLLMILGAAHRAQVVHGAVVADNVLIHPEKHGLILLDWCYSTEYGQPMRALVTDGEFPLELEAGKPVDGRLDIFMAGKLLNEMVEHNTRKFHAFGYGLAAPDHRVRPFDAWKLLVEFDDLLERAYGPRKFRPFTVKAD